MLRRAGDGASEQKGEGSLHEQLPVEERGWNARRREEDCRRGDRT